MNQEQFVEKHQAEWKAFKKWLDARDLKETERQPELDFPHAYRRICHQLSLARSRMYGQAVIDPLSQLVLRGHQQLYRRHAPLPKRITQFLFAGFPATVRQQWIVMLISAILFFGSFGAVLLAIQLQPDLVFSIMDPAQVANMEEMYNPELHHRLGREREADSDIMMFGFYIKNNTGIGFQTFAGGLLFGLGTLFFLVYNGLFIGAAAGHLTEIGYIETFWGFVAGHSAMELMAIVVSGAAGLKLGEALIRPGRKSRALALQDNAKIAVKLVYGAMTMFFIAAFIEAFWSSIAVLPVWIKYTVGIALWCLVLGYFAFAGRGYDEA